MSAMIWIEICIIIIFFFKYKNSAYMRLVGSIVFTYSFGLVSLWKLISGYWTSYLLLNVGALKNTCKVTCDRKSTPIDWEELLLCGVFQQQGNLLMEHYAYLVYISRTWFLVGFYFIFFVDNYQLLKQIFSQTCCVF